MAISRDCHVRVLGISCLWHRCSTFQWRTARFNERASTGLMPSHEEFRRCLSTGCRTEEQVCLIKSRRVVTEMIRMIGGHADSEQQPETVVSLQHMLETRLLLKCYYRSRFCFRKALGNSFADKDHLFGHDCVHNAKSACLDCQLCGLVTSTFASI